MLFINQPALRERIQNKERRRNYSGGVNVTHEQLPATYFRAAG